MLDLYRIAKKNLQKDSLAVAIRYSESTHANYDEAFDAPVGPGPSARLHHWDKNGKNPCAAFGVWGAPELG